MTGGPFFLPCKTVNPLELIDETLATYRRHGWRLRRALLTPEVRARLTVSDGQMFEDAVIEDFAVNALWFARASHAGREAWELRLVAETPYALFETFEADEEEEDREEVRRDMEARLREFAARP